MLVGDNTNKGRINNTIFGDCSPVKNLIGLFVCITPRSLAATTPLCKRGDFTKISKSILIYY